MTQPIILVSLVGHQPLPTLLAIRHLQPEQVILVGSHDRTTNGRRENLLKLLAADNKKALKQIAHIATAPVNHNNFLSVQSELEDALYPYTGAKLFCDMTDGTKPMAMGLMLFAQQRANTELLYITSDGPKTELWRYHFQSHSTQCPTLQPVTIKPEPIPSLLSIDDLLVAYLDSIEAEKEQSTTVQQEPGAIFEQDVYTLLAELVDESRTGIKPLGAEEIDIILRKRNRFAFVECKSGKKSRTIEGILQLANLASERYLGTYTGKILVVNAEYPPNNREVAYQHNVYLVEVPAWEPGHTWTPVEKEKFQTAIRRVFNE